MTNYEQIADGAMEYLWKMITPLVSTAPHIDIKIDERGILLSVVLNREDVGKIIGKNGETIKAIRRLIRQFGLTNSSHISVKVNE